MEKNGMMQRMMVVALVLLLNVVAVCAQNVSASSLQGTWKMDAASKEKYGLTGETEGVDILFRFADKKDVFLAMQGAYAEDGSNIVIAFEFPGTYTLKKDKVTTRFDKSKGELKILSIESDDPDIQQMIATEESRKAFYELMSSMVKEQLKDQMADVEGSVSEMLDALQVFKVVTLTANQMTLSIGNETASFERVK